LAKLELHINRSGRILDDLRTLRRLLFEERGSVGSTEFARNLVRAECTKQESTLSIRQQRLSIKCGGVLFVSTHNITFTQT